MKSNLLIGVLAASMFALPAWAGGARGHGPGSGSGSGSPIINTSSSATGGAGGAGGAATGGSATGGAATGGASNVTVSVGTGTASASPGAATLGAVGAPGSSAYNTQATVQYGGDYTVKNVPTAAPPALTTTLSDTCMGSVSLGVSAVGFGVTGGMTMVDEACVRRLDSREFRSMGMNDVALALLCQSESNRKAIEATGRSCPNVPKQQAEAAAAANVQTYAVNAQNSSNQYTDPIVRKRMGLEPLP